MEDKKSAKKAAKRKSTEPVETKPDSEPEDSDTDITDYGNGIETPIHENDDSHSSDGGWSSDDDRELVEKVKSTSKENDKVNFKTRLKQLNWSDVAFKTYSGDECKKRFASHLKNVRKYRTLNEIVTDIEANINKCGLKKPLNSYQLFVQEQLANVKSSGDFSETMKNLATRYKNLTPEERAVYKNQAEQLSKEYKIKKKAFLSGVAPKTQKAAAMAAKSLKKHKSPVDLFVESTKRPREEYSNLSLEEKYKWITKAISLSSDVPLTEILNKDEINLFNGRVKQTPAAYNLFVKDTYNKLKDKYEKKVLFTEVAQRWKSLDPSKRKTYLDAAAILKEKAIKEQEEFNQRHGLTPNKRRKSVYVEEPVAVVYSDDEEEEEEQEKKPIIKLPKPKKRKTSESSPFEEPALKEPIHRTPAKQEKPLPAKETPAKQEKPSPAKQTPAKQEKPLPAKQTPTKQAAALQTPPKSVEEKKKKKLSVSESDEYTGKEESDAGSSSTSTSSKKKSKKEKKLQAVPEPGNKPPSTFFKYFATHIHTGKPHKAQKRFNKLTKDEKKQLTAEYNEKVQSYVANLKKYLASLSKEDAIAYISKIKATEDEENDEAPGDNETSSQEY